MGTVLIPTYKSSNEGVEVTPVASDVTDHHYFVTDFASQLYAQNTAAGASTFKIMAVDPTKNLDLSFTVPIDGTFKVAHFPASHINNAFEVHVEQDGGVAGDLVFWVDSLDRQEIGGYTDFS